MGMIRNHLLQMKTEQPLEYLRLMRGYESEDEFVREAVGLSNKAINYYKEINHVRSADYKERES